MQDAHRQGLTIGIPVYNEEAILVPNVMRLLAYLDSLAVPYEVLLGSNGSVDGTVRIGRELDAHLDAVRFFHLPRRGVGLAFAEFVRLARHPVLVSLDMDLSTDLAFLRAVLAAPEQCDIVVGSKRLAGQRRSRFRRFGSDAFLRCARLLTGLPYDDYSIGAKAYSTQLLREFAPLIGSGSSYVLDLCHHAARAGRCVRCVPVFCEDHRSSKFNLAAEGFYKFNRLFALWASSGSSASPQRRQVIGVADDLTGTSAEATFVRHGGAL